MKVKCKILKRCMDKEPGTVVDLVQHHAELLERQGYVQILTPKTKVVRSVRNKAAG